MMAGGLRRFLPVAFPSRKGEEDDDPNNVDYSFAIEYSGPPVTCDIPRAVPVDVTQIPIAAAVVSASLLNDATLPVIQPIVKSNFSCKKLPNEAKLGFHSPVGVGTNGVLNENCTSRDSSDRVDKSNALCCATGDDNGTVSSGEEGSPARSDGCVGSPETSGRVLETPDHRTEGGEFQDYMNANDCELVESESSHSHSNSSEIFSCQEDDNLEKAPSHVKRPSIVTFRDPELNDVVQEEESDVSESESSVPVRSNLSRPGKKGTCYRCLKGNKLTEKEVCIVCGAKYCYNCVLRAMGSMPEGRKCISCIGHRIDEAHRKNLGRCSRLLKQLLPALEIKRIMSSEKSCSANQLPPELIYVNREPLSQEELVVLQTCPNPPKKLKPGNYWYDKVSGFWGKEGQKPCQIISPQLNIGGHIQEDASNGHTNIMINNRRITKGELLMLKLAGVKCEGATHFWVSADGSYQEEGMNNVKGNIWNNYRTKLICVALRLPSPPDVTSSNVEGANCAMPEDFEEKTVQKLLLVGCEKSGTSTIFKQAKILYKVPFSEDELVSIKSIIQGNLYGYLGILLEWREQFEAESLIQRRRRSINQCSPSAGNAAENDHKSVYSLASRLKPFSEWLLQVMMSGNLESMMSAASREYAPLVQELWKDAAIQASYNRRNEIDALPRVATYFLERAIEISKPDYQPSDMDILYAEGIASSKGLSCMEFSFPKSAKDNSEHIGYVHNPSLRYQLIRVHPKTLGGNCKWLEMFEDVDIVLFCVSLIDYDDECPKVDNGVHSNKMMASKQLFETIVTHPTFEDKQFLLILSKFDLLEEKIEQVPLTICEWFHDFNPVIGNPNGSGSTNPSLAHRAFQYISVKFKRLFHSLTDRKLFVSAVTGLEPDHIDEGLRYAREILKWEQEESNFRNIELSSASIEASSSS